MGSYTKKAEWFFLLLIVLLIDSGLTGHSILGNGVSLIVFPDDFQNIGWRFTNILFWCITTATEANLLLSLCLCAFNWCKPMRDLPRELWLFSRIVLLFLGCMGTMGNVVGGKYELASVRYLVTISYVFLAHTLFLVAIDFIYSKRAARAWWIGAIPHIVINSPPRDTHRIMDSEEGEIHHVYPNSA